MSNAKIGVLILSILALVPFISALQVETITPFSATNSIAEYKIYSATAGAYYSEVTIPTSDNRVRVSMDGRVCTSLSSTVYKCPGYLSIGWQQPKIRIQSGDATGATVNFVEGRVQTPAPKPKPTPTPPSSSPPAPTVPIQTIQTPKPTTEVPPQSNETSTGFIFPQISSDLKLLGIIGVSVLVVGGIIMYVKNGDSHAEQTEV